MLQNDFESNCCCELIQRTHSNNANLFKKIYNKRLNSDVNPHGALQNISSLWENVLLVKRRLESGRLKERKQLH